MSSPPDRQDNFPLGRAEFVFLLAAFQALQGLAVDIMLPALGPISSDLAVSNPNDRQLVIGVFLICAGLGSLVHGVLADRFGRKPVIVCALCAYVFFSLVCALAPSFTLLLLGRGVMGFFSSALVVMPMTVLRDRFEGDEMARTHSLVAVIFMAAPVIAPVLGQAILLVAQWRWIFGSMAAIAAVVLVWVALRLPETLDPGNRQEIRGRVIACNLLSAFAVRESLGYIVGTAVIQAALFGFLNSSQQLMGEHFGAGTTFPALFGGMALAMAGTNFINARIVERFGARRVSQTALLAYILMAVVHLWIVMSGGETLTIFVVLMTFNMCMMSFIGGNFQAISLQPFQHTAGAAASVVVFCRLLGGAVLGALIGQAYDGTARPIFVAMTIAGVVTLVSVLYSERGRLFRRLNYPVGYYEPGKRPRGNG